ncbi:hypothetical protein GCM10027610_024300 [Dactylosporangium cerinum]
MPAVGKPQAMGVDVAPAVDGVAAGGGPAHAEPGAVVAGQVRLCGCGDVADGVVDDAAVGLRAADPPGSCTLKSSDYMQSIMVPSDVIAVGRGGRATGANSSTSNSAASRSSLR